MKTRYRLANSRFRYSGLAMLLAMVVSGASAAEYHVAPSGRDAGAGGREAPFRTIQRAADVMQPGDTCILHEGVYREWVRPPRGGAAEDRRITYRAARGEKVVVKGSEPVTGWRRQGDVWRVELPDAFFGNQNPFKRRLAGDWLHFGTEQHLGAVYLDHQALAEQFTREAVQATPMTWCVEARDDRTVVLANFGAADPNRRLTEVNVRECIFFPAVKGLKYITLDGLQFAQAAPQWAYWNAYQEAAVGTYFGAKWIIQNCRFSDIRCTALVCGNDPCKPTDGQDIRAIGRHVVRNNHFERCGEAALHGNWGWAGSLIEGNLIEDINVRNEFGGMETAGMKIHYAVDVTVKGNVVRRVYGRKPSGYTYKWGPEFAAIWIDWGAQGTRITGNVVYDCEALALFVQNSHGSPVVVDNNIFAGRSRLNTQGVIYAHNLFANCPWNIRTGATGPFWKPHSGDRAAVAPIPVAQVKWWNNIFVGHGAESFPQAEGYASDWNVFYGGAAATAWGDRRSRVETGGAAVTFKTLPGGVEVGFTATSAVREVQAPRLTHEFIAPFALTGQGLEDADGRPFDLDGDVLDAGRSGAHATIGPLANPVDGVNRFVIGAGPGDPK